MARQYGGWRGRGVPAGSNVATWQRPDPVEVRRFPVCRAIYSPGEERDEATRTEWYPTTNNNTIIHHAPHQEKYVGYTDVHIPLGTTQLTPITETSNRQNTRDRAKITKKVAEHKKKSKRNGAKSETWKASKSRPPRTF